MVSRLRNACQYFATKWEVLFFLTAYLLLVLQVFFFVDLRSPSYLHGAVAAYATFESFASKGLFHVSLPAILLPSSYILLRPTQPPWTRRYLDILGTYVIARMVIQLIGLNILVFDTKTSHYLLLTQLLFFLPYSLLIWGWVYWRLDSGGRSNTSRQMFRLDCKGNIPRPIDFYVASFSSVFSASIDGIKGNSTRTKMLTLAHGFFIYDVVGLTLSRAIALISSR